MSLVEDKEGLGRVCLVKEVQKMSFGATKDMKDIDVE